MKEWETTAMRLVQHIALSAKHSKLFAPVKCLLNFEARTLLK
jgi:hypothetical protein